MGALVTKKAPRARGPHPATKEADDEARRAVVLASAAHELKTPLAIVMGYVDLLLSEKPGGLSAQQKRLLEEARENCTRMRRCIDDAMSAASAAAGKLPMNLVPGDLGECLSELYSIWLARFQEHGVAFYYPSGRPLPAFPFDYQKVQRIVSALLENALKYTPSVGTVWLTAEPYRWERREQGEAWDGQERRRRARRTPNAACITVADTGPGIRPEYQQEIFEEFSRAPGSKESSEGVGLGLAIARRLVTAHKGKIWVESEHGVGSRFSLLLPFRPL